MTSLHDMLLMIYLISICEYYSKLIVATIMLHIDVSQYQYGPKVTDSTEEYIFYEL